MTLRTRNQRGQALALTAIALVVLVGFTFLVLNVAYVAHVASEIQAAADATATAGAKALADGATDVDTEADKVAVQNAVAGQALTGSDVTTVKGYYDVVNNTFSLTLPSDAVWNAVHTTVTKNLTGKGFFGPQWLPFWSMQGAPTVAKEAYAIMPVPSGQCDPNTFKADLPLAVGDCAVTEGKPLIGVPDGICYNTNWSKGDCKDPTSRKKAWWAGYEDGAQASYPPVPSGTPCAPPSCHPSCIDAREVEVRFPVGTCAGALGRTQYRRMSTTAFSTGKNVQDGTAATCVKSYWQSLPAGTVFNIGMFDCTTTWNAEWCDADPKNYSAGCPVDSKVGPCTYPKKHVDEGIYPSLSGCAVVQVLNVGSKTVDLNVVSWTKVVTPGVAETGGVNTRLVQPTPVP